MGARHWLLTTTILGLLLATTSPAKAMVDWTESAPVTGLRASIGVENYPVLATDSEGDAWVLVARRRGLLLAEHPADGGAATLHTLDEDGWDGSLVIDGEDRITVVYARYGESTSIVARAVSPDGAVGPLNVVSAPEFRNGPPRAAVAPDGTVTVAWQEVSDPETQAARLRLARLDPGTAAPIADPVTLDEPGTRIVGMRVAGDARGRMTVVWSRSDPVTNNAAPTGMFALRVDRSGQPGVVHQVSPPGTEVSGGVGELLVGPRGAATVVWTAATQPRASTWASRIPADRSATSRQVLVSEPDEASTGKPSATLDPLGRVTIVWARRAGPGFEVVETRRLSVDGTPQQTRPTLGVLAYQGPRDLLGVVADSTSAVTVVFPARVFSRNSSQGSRIHSVLLDPRGRPSSERMLSRDAGSHGYVLGVALAPDDRVVATWLDFHGARIARSAPSGAALVPADTGFQQRPVPSSTDRRPKVRLWSHAADATFECRLDRDRWRPCALRTTLPRLSYGKHRLAARATDVDGTGHDPTPAVARFEVVRR